jgi:RNA polymerase sigma-70 factor, ECF subfamily
VGWEDSPFQEFFASQYAALRRLGFVLTGDWSEGEELAQDALVRVYWRWALVRRQERPEAYARKVLINRHRSWLRRLRLDARHGGQARIQTADAGQREELLVVWAAIRRLPSRQRAVVVLRYHEDLPELEVARLLQMPVGTVKSTANRALARLRRDLAGRLVDHADTRREPR